MSSGSIPANDYTCSNGTCYYNMYVYAQIPAMEYAQANTPNYDDTVGITILCSNCTQGASSFSESLYLNLQDTLTSCGVNAASLVFPNYSGSMVTGTSTITVQCGSAGGTTQFTVGLDGGQNGGSVTNPRNLVLAGGTQKLQYNLCTNSGTGCTAWGNSSGGTQQTGTENGSVIPFTVYGQIPASSGNATNKTALQHPGSYSDTITVSLTY
jgi:spore coat protein U-like protein